MESEFSSYSAALIFSTADSLHLPELFLAGGEPFLLFVLTSSAALFFLLLDQILRFLLNLILTLNF